MAKGLNRPAKFIQIFQALLLHIQDAVYGIRQHTSLESKLHIRRITDSGPEYGLSDLAVWCGQIQPCLGGAHALLSRQHQQRRLVAVLREVMTVIELRQPHSVVIDRPVECDHAIVSVNEKQSSFIAIQVVQFLFAGAAAVEHYVVILAHLLQIRKICDDRDLLAGKSQVDKVGHIEIVIADRRPLELSALYFIAEAVQPLG